MNPLNLLHWIHHLAIAGSALVFTWLWIRGGFWLPRYVHAIALGALIAGVFVTRLCHRLDPDPVIQLIFPVFLPAIFVGSAYAVAIFFGFAEIAKQSRVPAKIRVIAYSLRSGT